ncbi:hypothetical protein AN946_03760 [Trueperella pyogenes]|nr:hypothetical protein AN946_03760 [Trueperella pyogenes]
MVRRVNNRLGGQVLAELGLTNHLRDLKFKTNHRDEGRTDKLVGCVLAYPPLALKMLDELGKVRLFPRFVVVDRERAFKVNRNVIKGRNSGKLLAGTLGREVEAGNMRARTLDDEHRLAAILPLRVNPIEVELREQSLPSGLDVEGKERGVQTCRTDGHELAHADAAGKLNRGCLIHSMLLSNVHTCYITRGTGALRVGRPPHV